MNKVAIKVENLGKKYVINHEKENGENTFREVIVGGTKKIMSFFNPFSKEPEEVDHSTEEFWALNDVSFEINKGDKVGIIGRNGAGKSTLLKVLSRITEPTTGKIHINGRIASLLEVGTGFHPELTGRENIYLNGAILGMSRKEIKAKFDEIVAFAEVDKFLDTPVKRYSSGMYVRLAFSVAAHLEPEILVVDEVLAVGDVEFQKKCLGKMQDVSEQGRTILFVSHNMAAIEQLCNQVILLENGCMVQQNSNVREGIQRYLTSDDTDIQQSVWKNENDKYRNEYFQPVYFAIEHCNGDEVYSSIRNDEQIAIVIEGDTSILDSSLIVGFAVYNEENVAVFSSSFKDLAPGEWLEISKGVNKIKCEIPTRFLNEGRYRVEMAVALNNKLWIVQPLKDSPILFFTVEGGLSDSPYWTYKREGVIAPVLEWKVY